jgi:hypothetical protein
MTLLKKAPAPVPGCGHRPQDGPQSDLFSVHSTQGLIAEIASDETLEEAYAWLCKRRKDDSAEKKAPTPVPGCGHRPEDGPQSDLFSVHSLMRSDTYLHLVQADVLAQEAIQADQHFRGHLGEMKSQ